MTFESGERGGPLNYASHGEVRRLYEAMSQWLGQNCLLEYAQGTRKTGEYTDGLRMVEGEAPIHKISLSARALRKYAPTMIDVFELRPDAPVVAAYAPACYYRVEQEFLVDDVDIAKLDWPQPISLGELQAEEVPAITYPKGYGLDDPTIGFDFRTHERSPMTESSLRVSSIIALGGTCTISRERELRDRWRVDLAQNVDQIEPGSADSITGQEYEALISLVDALYLEGRAVLEK